MMLLQGARHYIRPKTGEVLLMLSFIFLFSFFHFGWGHVVMKMCHSVRLHGPMSGVKVQAQVSLTFTKPFQ